MANQYLLQKPAYMYPWEKRTLYLGRLPDAVRVAYGAATLLVSLGNPITVRIGNQCRRGISFLIPAGTTTLIDAGLQIVAVLHLDVLGDDCARFDGCFQNSSQGEALMSELQDEVDYRALLSRIYHQPCDSTQLYGQLDALLEFSFNQVRIRSNPDPQIAATVDLIKQRFQDNIPIKELAERVQLSTPSLIRRFKRQAGIPIRRFRLWHRIYESMIFISDGQNLTDAALNAGFADSSHYTHTLQTMWGVTPSGLFTREIRAEIVPPECRG